MGDVVEVGKFIRCSICGKRQATVLCDMPIGSSKTMHMPNIEDSFKEETITCDRHVCNRCCKEVGHNRHICRMCIEKLKD